MKSSLENISLSTERLDLRSVQLGDEVFLYPEIDDDLTKYWIGWEAPSSLATLRDDIKDSLKRAGNGTKLELCAFHHDTHEFIGITGITQYLTPAPDFYEIDVWVKHSAQGRGYAKEMILGLLDWLKLNTELSSIVYSYTEGNEASKKIIEQIGFQKGPWINEEMKRGKKVNTFNFLIIL